MEKTNRIEYPVNEEKWNNFLKMVHKTKVFKGTWLNRPGESYEYLFEKDKHGLRIIVHTWSDTKEVEIVFVDGDGRTIDFKRYKKLILQKTRTVAEGQSTSLDEKRLKKKYKFS